MKKYKIAYFGNFTEGQLSPEIIAIYNNDLEVLKTLLGKNINKTISITCDIFKNKFTPLEIALYLNKKEIVTYLLTQNASQKCKFYLSPIEIAVRYCDAETVLLFKNYLKNLSEDKKSNLFKQVFWAENDKKTKIGNIEILEDLGISIAQYGGSKLRDLASENDLEMAKLFLEKGADINFNKSDMVFPYESTPVIEAARNNNFEMVKFLVENGADILLKDKYGDRPYSLAIKNGNAKMAKYLKNFEPKEFHDLENKKQSLKSYKLPKDLENFLMGDNLTFKINDKYCKFIRFFSYIDTIETKWKGKKVLSIVAEVDNYSIVDIVWYPSKKMIYAIDEEHETFTPLATWEEFYLNMEKYITSYLDGELE